MRPSVDLIYGRGALLIRSASRTFQTTTVRSSDGIAAAINPVIAWRQITIRDLMTHTSGASYGGGDLEELYTAAGFTVNHIGNLYVAPGRGFGLGFETVEDLGRSGRYGSEGEFSWGSAYFSRYWVDPKEQLIAVFLAQLQPSVGLDLQEKLRALVNQAIVGPPPVGTAHTLSRQ
jgi:CubicO group peptidase (beta-lactamase class C family)